MRYNIHLTWIGLVGIIAILALSGCSTASAAETSPTTTPIRAPVAPISAPTAAPTLAPTATPLPLPTATSAPPPLPTATAIATRRPTTASPRVSATPVIPPGVYVTALKADPAIAKSKQTPQFTVTFLNTTAQMQRFNWYIKIFSPDQQNSFGETMKFSSDIPANTAQLSAAANWQTQTYFGCLTFTARAFWVNSNGDAVEFLKPDGTSLGAPLSICP